MSFSEYIKDKYFDLIYTRLKSYVYYQKDNIPFKLKYIDDIQQVWLEDAYIKKFYIYDYPNNEIGINIIVETYVTLKEYKKGEYKSDSDYPWFLVSCKCEFTDDIKNFKIQNIEPYNGVYEKYKSLTDNLVPYIKKEEMDEYAENLLKKHYPEVLNDKILSPYDFAEKLGLKIEKINFNDSKCMGAIHFDDVYVKTKDGKSKRFPPNTIFVSRKFNEKRTNFTIMHECVHYLLHIKCFFMERLYNKDARHISCNIDGTGSTSAKSSSIEWMEWQANNLAPKLLMPARSFKTRVNNLIKYYNIHFNDNDDLETYETLIYDLSEIYNITPEVVKIRLVELGYEFALGCFNYVDGKHVRPHSFSKGSLNMFETFSINELDALKCCLIEKYSNNNEKIYDYVYVENNLCLNDSKYIEKNEKIGLSLTSYARHHMDECCLKFEIDLKNQCEIDEIGDKTFKILNRKNNDSELVVSAHNSFKISPSHNNNIMQTALKKEALLYNNIPRTAKGLFKVLKEYSGFTNEELVNGTGLSKNTIDKYLYDESPGYKLDVVLRLLLFMNIPNKVSFLVLDICNCKLSNNDEHLWIAYVLTNRWIYKFEDNINFLTERKIFI